MPTVLPMAGAHESRMKKRGWSGNVMDGFVRPAGECKLLLAKKWDVWRAQLFGAASVHESIWPVEGIIYRFSAKSEREAKKLAVKWAISQIADMKNRDLPARYKEFHEALDKDRADDERVLAAAMRALR